MTKNSGFTLLEVLIAVVILAFISVFTVQSIQRALRDKARITRDIDRLSEVRGALRVMERDINMAFNYRDANIELFNQAQKARQNKKAGGGTKDPGGKAPPPPPTPPPPGTAEEFALKKEVRLTQFIGTGEELHFTSRSHVRTHTNQIAGDQAEIGYSVKSCKSRGNLSESSNCLWRRINPYIDDKVEEGGVETALLENVVTFELRYLGPETEDWVTAWSSGEGADDSTRDKFPHAVEVTIETQNTKIANSKATRMTMVAAIRNPNNPKPPPKTEGEADGPE